ncbi:hypothetical protein BC833DRAFT_625248, partial [Globomyces pollinis-pini]
HLGFNTFSGELPKDLSGLVNLKYLNVRVNQLVGSIQGILFPASLEELDLSQNQFYGELPLDFSALIHLHTLYLNNNKFSGPINAIKFPKSIVYLNMEGNKISGDLPEDLDGLVNLQYLNMNSNYLSGSIHKILFPSSLVHIYLGGNQVSGELPPDLSALTNLRTFYFNSNNLTGLISGIKFPTSLVHLALGGNRFSGELPHDLSELINLETLFLASNEFSGPIHSILLPKSLVTVIMNDNNLSGSLPQNLSGLVKLQYLYLNSNELSGSIKDVVLPKSLVYLAINENKLSGELPQNWIDFINLQYLYLNNNQFSGSIESILFPTTLEYLKMNDNALSGEFPKFFGSLSKLKILELSGNKLSGTIGDGYFPTSIERVGMNKNSISGELLQDFSVLFNLKHLDLSFNNLTGELKNIVKLPKSIEYLNLESNKFTGEVPKSYADETLFPVLKEFILRNNKLSGFFHGKKTFSYCDIRGNGVCDPLEPSPCFMEKCFDGSKICDIARGLNPSLICATSNDYCKDRTQDWYKCDENDKVISINITNGRFKHQNQEVTVASNAYINESLYGLQNLETLVLSGNALNIPLITTVDVLSNLKHIDLSKNLFYGSITGSFTKLKKLTYLDLSNNLLGFGIPRGFKGLNYLNLTGNQFTGKFKKDFTGICEITGPEINVCDPSTVGLASCGLQLCSSISLIERYENLQQQYQNLIGRFRKVNSRMKEFIQAPISNSILRSSFSSDAELYKYVLDVFIAFTNVELLGTNGDDALNVLTVGNVALNLGQLLQDFSQVSNIGYLGAPNGGMFGNGDFANTDDGQGGTSGFPDGQSDFSANEYLVFVNNTNPAIPVSGSSGMTQTVTTSDQIPTNVARLGPNANTNTASSISNTESSSDVVNAGNSEENDQAQDANGVALKIDKSDATKMAGSAVIAGGLGLAMLL